jgi:hypothetical protein
MVTMRVFKRLFASSPAIVAIATFACLSLPSNANAAVANIDAFVANKRWVQGVYSYVNDLAWQYDLSWSTPGLIGAYAIKRRSSLVSDWFNVTGQIYYTAPGPGDDVGGSMHDLYPHFWQYWLYVYVTDESTYYAADNEYREP